MMSYKPATPAIGNIPYSLLRSVQLHVTKNYKTSGAANPCGSLLGSYTDTTQRSLLLPDDHTRNPVVEISEAATTIGNPYNFH